MTQFPHSEFRNIEDITLSEELVSDFCVLEGRLRLECRLNITMKNNYLIVMPNGAVDRKKNQIPAFARWNWHTVFNSNVLSISDPALYLDENLPIGWFAGTKDLDITSFVANVVVKVALLLKIPSNRIVFWNSSAGGYASILLASKIDGANFVCINGQTEIIKYYSGHIEAFRKVFDSTSEADTLSLSFPEQWSAIQALENSYEKGKVTNGVVIQNIIDKMHYEKHYIPFCNHFNLPIEGGSNKNLHSILYSHDKGHGPEPVSLSKEVIRDYLPKLFNN
ncbi:hypothetical protein [Psychrobacter immobilis]|uniref:hypothetical protein n=1 Tax=Psychrobacter immobilis TaxID=498 RepID=UPI001919FF13|nr:hypothetical protein [Psychrobacter immobilis]